jgi:hypothetical protein
MVLGTTTDLLLLTHADVVVLVGLLALREGVTAESSRMVSFGTTGCSAGVA